MKIGYAPISTEEQNFDLQRDSLKKAGCNTIITDKGVSGNSSKREVPDRAIQQIQKDDVLILWKI